MFKFEISYPGGTTHEVELSGSVVVLGRDPGCDLVLNDTKCSRRHAVVEEGPEGVVVRDTESANGTHVNGRRVERALLTPGDVIRLGEVQLRLVEQIGETVVMAPEDLLLRTSAEAPGPPEAALPLAEALMITPRPKERPAPVRPPREPRRPTEPRPLVDTRTVEPRPRAVALPGRPATVSVLVALWALFVPVSVAGCLFAAYRLGGGALAWAIGGLASFVLAALGTVMALGLRALAPWARHLQVATAAFGLLVCPFTLASATVLLYLTRPEVKAAFESGHGRGAGDGTAEATFALSLLGMLGVGIALAAAAVLIF